MQCLPLNNIGNNITTNSNHTSPQNVLGCYFDLIRFKVSPSSKPSLIKPGVFKLSPVNDLTIMLICINRK